MGTDGDQRVHHVFGAHEPDAELVLPALVDLAHGVVGDKSGLELLHRLEEDVGKHEPAEHTGQAAEGGGEGEPGGGDDEWEASAGNFPLLANVGSRAAGEGGLRYYLIWRDFFRHQEIVKKRNKRCSGR